MRLRLPSFRRARAEPASPARQPTPPWRRVLGVLRPRSLRDALRRNPGLKLVSLVLAFFLWFSINVSERDAERVVDLRVVVRRLSSELVVTNPPTKPVTVTLRGPRTLLDGVDEQRQRLAVNLAEAGPGEVRVELASEMIRPDLPHRMKVVRIEPPRLRVRVERVAQRRLGVRPDLAGTPALGYMVAESQVRPAEVLVSGPASTVDALKELTTEPIEIHGVSATLRRDVLVAWVGDFVSFVPDHVTVTIGLDEIVVAREFKRIGVRVVGAAGRPVTLEPRRVSLTVSGPQRVLHNFKVADDAAFVDATDLGPGRHRVPAQLELPAELEVTRRRPDALTLDVAEVEP